MIEPRLETPMIFNDTTTPPMGIGLLLPIKSVLPERLPPLTLAWALRLTGLHDRDKFKALDWS
jgi:hypothetical protein